ncbi:MAG: glycosyltransferase [Alphaproteobacteria bacterium]
MHIVMLANNACVFDARIRREAEALVDDGHEVSVLATSAHGLPDRETVGGVDYLRIFKVREIRKSLEAQSKKAAAGGRWRTQLKSLVFKAGRRMITPSLRHLIGYAHAYRQAIAGLAPDVVHAHDLDTLFAGWLGAHRAKAALVYDAHELETDRNLPMVPFEKTYRAFVERLLIRRCDAVITVSDSIADHLAKRYRLTRPTVVLNAPAAEAAAAERDGDIRTDLQLAADMPLALYVGGVMPARGLEPAVRALAHLPDLHLALLGPRQEATERQLGDLAEALRVRDRLHLVDPVPPGRLRRYIASADVSLVLIQNICLSYRYCFPNKLLLSLFAGLPVVAARLVELERMIERTGAGLVVDETDPKAIADAIAAILAAPDRYRPDSDVIRSLEESHGWAAQKTRLLACYDKLAPAVYGRGSELPENDAAALFSGAPPR